MARGLSESAVCAVFEDRCIVHSRPGDLSSRLESSPLFFVVLRVPPPNVMFYRFRRMSLAFWPFFTKPLHVRFSRFPRFCRTSLAFCLFLAKTAKNAWDVPPKLSRGVAPGRGVGEGVECVTCLENEQNARDIHQNRDKIWVGGLSSRLEPSCVLLFILEHLGRPVFHCFSYFTMGFFTF